MSTAVERATVIPAGGGEVVGDAPDRRVEILCEDDALHATWSRFGPHREGADPHVHRHHNDLFYVLDGELSVRLGPGGERVALPAGTLARVPPLVVHGFGNETDAEVRYLNFHAPGVGFADYMRALRDGGPRSFDQHEPPPDGGRPATEAVIGGGAGLLADIEEIAVADATGDPADASPHIHRRHAEAFYVLEGTLVLTAGGRELRADAGSWVQIPPGVPHAVSAGGRARYLNLHAPSYGFGALDREPAG